MAVQAGAVVIWINLSCASNGMSILEIQHDARMENIVNNKTSLIVSST